MGVGISIHALRGESDQMAHILAALMPEFQSTPSARRATRRRPEERLYRLHFNPRPPRGGRRGFNDFLLLVGDFNPRPPRGERRLSGISRVYLLSYFNPRPPRGERPGRSGCGQTCHRFQSTPSARRATGVQQSCPLVGGISIHALREESDTCSTC